MRFYQSLLFVFLMWSWTCFSSNLHAQSAKERLSLTGTVKDEKGRPLELASVILDNSLVAHTRNDGSFIFAGLPRGVYRWSVKFVGYETNSGVIKIETGHETLNVTLKELSLGLSQVTVVARQHVFGSTSKIGQEAIRHLQPKSLGDLLQLLPGNLTRNPNLNNLSQAYIREISGNAANALGTAIIVDGTPLSNDANLEVLAPTKYGASADRNGMQLGANGTAGRGIDLRTITAGNVESMEVIRGIPGVEYGNLNSGVVIVNTKSGHTPWEAKFQADPNSKLAYLGKGFKLRYGGAFNFSIDWAQSWADTRLHYKGYDRITASSGYSHQFGNLSFNVRAAFHTSINNTKRDPQMTESHSEWKNHHSGGRLSVYGQYKGNHSLFSNIEYKLSGQLSRQHDRMNNWVYNPDGVVTDTRHEGLHKARFKRTGYSSEYTIESVPLHLYGQIAANKYIRLGDNNYTALKMGAEYNYDGNHGRGMNYDENNPPQAQSSHTLRPRAYKDIPALRTLTFFLSDRTSLSLGKTKMQLDAGVRMSNLFLDADKSGGNRGYFLMEPRTNLSVNLLNRHNNRFLDDLTLTGGFGLSNKMPTLLYLYPDKAYYDNVALGRWSDDENNRLALVATTIVENTQNPSLKPTHTKKWEIGLSLSKGKTQGTLTFFRELHTNEFGFISRPLWIEYPYFELPSGAQFPIFDSNSQNVNYTLDGSAGTASKTFYTERLSWGMPANTSRSIKHGVEYTLNVGEWPAIRTGLNITGAWFHIKRQRTTLAHSNIHMDTRLQHNNFDMVVLPSGYGTINERLNTNFVFVTHIPTIKMIFTTTLQVVWRQSSQMIYEDENDRSRYALQRFSDKNYMVVNPIGYYDINKKWHDWSASDAENPMLNIYMGRQQTYDLEKSVINPWAMLSLRLTKEIGKSGEISFIANNLTNTRKYQRDKHSNALYQLYPNLYFGAEVKLKF